MRTFLLFFLIVLSGVSAAQDIPDPMQPPRMVNDFSGLLDAGRRNSLEKILQDFYYETSTQIYIVILDDLGGYDISDFSFRLGEKWGIGTKGRDNGILILLNPSPDRQHGDAYIATGYGLEGAVPDITCNHIVTYDLIPHFRQLDYYGGLLAASQTIMDLTRGEYTADEYLARKQQSGPGPIGLVFMIPFIIIILSIFGRARTRRYSSAGHNLPFWLALFMLSGSGSSHRGSFGNFSSGSHGFGGFGGGFGGGGGGSFGGGGAGGSW
jgi:uncharacterized protein